MKFPYKLADGDIAIVVCSEEVAEFLKENDRLVSNEDRRYRYNVPYHIEANVYEGMEYADLDTPEEIFIRAEEEAYIEDLLQHLTETQLRRVLMRSDDMTIQEIADEEDADYSSVAESLNAAKKKLKKLMENTP